MENKRGSGASGSQGGKGFYAVLFLCAAVIGVSAWILLSGTKVDNENAAYDAVAASSTLEGSGAVVTMGPSASAARETEAESGTETELPSDEALEEVGAFEQQQVVFTGTVDSYVWPVRGQIEAPYAMQTLLYDATMGDWRTHDGIDIACDLGTQVLASAGGTVTAVYSDDLYGTTVEIDHANGVHTVYANLAAQPTVKEGDVVSMGQIIGSVGDTALGETNMVHHLHFAMKLDGLPTDPLEYLPAE